jgi:hypothetical protein
LFQPYHYSKYSNYINSLIYMCIYVYTHARTHTHTHTHTHRHRLRVLQGSQPAKIRNLNRLISNLSRLNWSSEHNCVHYCFSTVFSLSYNSLGTSTQDLSTPKYLFDLYLTAVSWPATKLFSCFLGQAPSCDIKDRSSPRETTSNHDNEARRGSDSVFYSLI